MEFKQALVSISSSLAQSIASSFGPLGNDKMIINPANQVLITNRGSVILESLKVEHPAAKLLLDTAKAIDENYGDGSSSFIIMISAALRESLKLVGSDSAIPLVLSLSDVLHNFVLTELPSELIKVSVGNFDKSEGEILDTATNLVRTAISGKTGNKATKFLVELIISLVFGEKKSEDLKQFGLNEICSSLISTLPISLISGVPFQYSKVLDGVLFEGSLIKNSHKAIFEQNLTFIALDCDFTGKQLPSKNQTTITLKGSADYQALANWESQRNNDVLENLGDWKVSVILCKGTITEENQSLIKSAGILAIERIEDDDLNHICVLAGVTQIYDISEIFNIKERKVEYIGTVNKIQEITHSGKSWIHFEVVENSSRIKHENVKHYTPRRCLILHGPTEGLCKQYRDMLLKALRVLKTWSEPIYINGEQYRYLSLPGGGSVEMFIHNLIEKKYVENNSTWRNKAFKVLSASLLDIVCLLVDNYTGDFEVFGVNKSLGRPIKLVTTLMDEVKKGTEVSTFPGFFIEPSGSLQITNVVEQGILEPFGIKYGLLVKVMECLRQLLRIDQVVSAKSSK
eukprot:TRINITY_DN10340_c0_g1_i1.p1 TRINITY_DN10340_c0_g1~~TRINITY_DN10340_c0_g1_i1.p1  ORF type:complete len:572 (+),score=108.43 TRINITY_DN10340_c0_g1_i1:197-1912(+)